MIRTLAACASLLLLASGPFLSAAAPDDAVERSFRGDRVHLDLSAGHYRVTASPDNRLRVRPRTKTDQVSTRITLNLLETRATIRVVGPKDGIEADIELPARVSVSVRGVPAFRWTGEGAHDLRVTGDSGRATRKN
jgi:hypothetical protein